MTGLKAFLDCLKEDILKKSSNGLTCILVPHVLLSKSQCPQDEKERAEMEKVPYASAVGSLMYAQVCTHLDIAFAVNALGRYLSNPGLNHWKAVKKVMRYLQGTKDYMLSCFLEKC